MNHFGNEGEHITSVWQKRQKTASIESFSLNLRLVLRLKICAKSAVFAKPQNVRCNPTPAFVLTSTDGQNFQDKQTMLKKCVDNACP